MKIITLLNEKGGVGKTTLSVHIAAGLAIRGHRVVLVDADPQANAGELLRRPEEAALNDLLVREAPFNKVLRPIAPEIISAEPVSGELWLIPSNTETRTIPLNISDVYVVRDRFEELDGWADVVIFDTAPTPSLLHGSIYLATDGIIYPTKPEPLSLRGLAKSLSRRDAAENHRQVAGLKAIKVVGIVPTMYRAGTVAHDSALQELRQEFGGAVWPAQPLRTTWVEASIARLTVFAYAPQSEATKDAWEMIDLTEEMIRKWEASETV